MVYIEDDCCENCFIKPSEIEGKGGYLCNECYDNRADIDDDMFDALNSSEQLLSNIGVHMFDSKWICNTCTHMHKTYLNMRSCSHQNVPNENYVFYTKRVYNEIYNGNRNVYLSYLFDNETRQKVIDAIFGHPYLVWNGIDEFIYLTCDKN